MRGWKNAAQHSKTAPRRPPEPDFRHHYVEIERDPAATRAPPLLPEAAHIPVRTAK